MRKNHRVCITNPENLILQLIDLKTPKTGVLILRFAYSNYSFKISAIQYEPKMS